LLQASYHLRLLRFIHLQDWHLRLIKILLVELTVRLHQLK